MRKIDPVDRHVRLIRLSRQEPARQQVIFGYREKEREKKITRYAVMTCYDLFNENERPLVERASIKKIFVLILCRGARKFISE